MTALHYPSFVAGLPLTRRALDFAVVRHGGQRRQSDDAPFILHPLEVAHLLHGRDYPDRVVAAGVLHDVIEDTDADYDELERLFGADVARLVCAVTEPPGEGAYAERKRRLRAVVADADAEAVAVFAADKVAKAREFRLSAARGSARRVVRVDREKLEHYWACLELVERRLGNHGLVRQLRFELEALNLFPPADGESSHARSC